MSFELAQEVSTTFKGSNVEKKIEALTKLKSFLKRNDVDAETIPLIFDSVKQGLASTNHTNLAQSALTCLVVLIKRMTLQDPGRLKLAAPHLLPLLVDRLGDVKDRYRELAMNSLVEFWKATPTDVEKTIKEVGFGNKSWRIREQSMRWLSNVHGTQHNFSFRSFTPFMMKILEDANEVVRDTAKEVVIELFKNAPGHAKADLKKLLQTNHVRKTTSEYILSQLGLIQLDNTTASVKSDEGFHEDPHLAPPPKPEPRTRVPSTTGSMTASVAGSVATTALLSAAGAEMEQMDACLIASKGDLEYEIQNMLSAFEGRESEQNWNLRDKHITRLRGLLRGNAYKEYPTTFMAGIGSLQGGIVKGISSLRTQLCLKSCELVKDLTIVTGPAMDPYADFFLTTFVKLSAGTKKLVLQATQVIVSVILANVSYNHKLTTQIWIAIQDKNQNPRICAAGWLKVLLEAHGENKAAIEHGTTGMENIEKTIQKGLADPSPDVRTPMRDTYWTFAKIWPERAEAISSKLDAAGRKALEKANPSNSEEVVASGRSSSMAKPADQLAASTSSVTSSSALANRNPLSGRVSIKKFAAEQRKKLENEEPSGLHSGPVRGLGQPQRPAAPSLKRLETVPAMPRPVSPSSSTTKTTRTGSPPRKGASTRTGSPPLSPKRKVVAPPRPSPLHTMTSPVGAATARPVGRRLTVLEQLVHAEWRIRVEGIVTVACLLAKKDPPGHPSGQKLPTLPPLDTLSPTLQKLLNDPQPEVVQHLLAPEVIPEIAKIVPVDQIVPRLLLLSEMEDEEVVRDITLSSSLPALKALFNDSEAADMLSRALMSMGVSGVVPRKLSVGFFTTTQKRKIIHGIFLWMIELIERHNSQIAAGETGSEYFLDETNYKQYIHRLVPMVTNTKPTSNNYLPLTTLLRVLRQSNQDVFDKVLNTFERSTVAELKRAWGQPVDEPEDTVVYEEKVVTVHEVLGDVTVGGLTVVASPPGQGRTPPSSPPRSRIPVISPPTSPRVATSTPRSSGRFHIAKSPSGNLTMNVDEDLTMINVPQAAGSDKENERTLNSKSIPTKHKPRVASREEPLNTFARDLRKNLPDVPPSQEIADQQKLLVSLIARLESKQMDSPGFHSLSRLCRKNHVDILRDPPSDAEYMWQGGNKFNELLRALLEYLVSTDFNVSPDRMIKLKIEAFDSGMKPLMRHQKPYFAGHETAVIRSLLNLRSQAAGNPIGHVVDEALLDFVDMVDSDLGTNILLKYVDPYVEERNRYDETQTIRKVPQMSSIVLTLKCLAVVIRKLTPAQVEFNLSHVAPLAITTLYDEDTEVRRQSVAMCVSLFLVLKDEQKVFEALRGIEKDSSKQNLLHYYFEHARRATEEMAS